MPLEASVRSRFKLPDLDFSKQLKNIADKIILTDIRFGINRSVGVDNQAFPVLEPATIARKAGVRQTARKSGGFAKAGVSGAHGGSQPLVDTGRLSKESMNSFQVERNHIRISIDPSRSQIAYFLQVEGVGKKKKKFNFFGISQRAEFQAISKMKEALKGSLAKINGR